MMTKTVMITAVVACVIILLGIGAYSTYIVFNWRSPDRPNFDYVSPIPIIHAALTADSKVDIPVSNNSSGSIIPHNQTDTGEWLTYHHDFFRTGFDPNQLSTNNNGSSSASINTSWTSDTLDGVIYAEPLIAQGMVFVATSNNTIYSLDSITGKILWRTNLGPAVPLSDLPCGNIDPIGIIGTPVIDLQTQTIFAVGFLGNTHTHELFGIDINTGKIRFEAPIDPPGSDPKVEQQRGALALSYYNGSSNNNTGDAGTVTAGGGVIVYIPFGGLYGDCGQYHGWIVGVPISYLSISNNSNSGNNSENSMGIGTGRSEETKQQLSLMSFQVPTRRQAGIWAPSGPAIDQNGSILIATGNGASKTNFDFGNSVIKLSPNLQKVIDWFAPSDWAGLSKSDIDLGSMGPSILGDNNITEQDMNHNNSTITSTIFQIGKEGIGYLLRGDKLGGVNGQVFSAPVCDKGAYGSTAYAAPYLFVPCREGLVALYLQSATDANNNSTSDSIGITNESKKINKLDNDTPHRGGNNYSSFIIKWTGPSFNAGPPIIADGLVWTVNINKGQLYAFNQSTGRIVLQQDIGDVAHFSTPSSSHGKIFVAASNKILSFSVN